MAPDIFLLFYGSITLTIGAIIARQVFGLSTIIENLKMQTKLLNDISKKLDERKKPTEENHE